MPTMYKWELAYTLEEMRDMLKAQNRKRAAEIPEILKKKQREYYV